MPLSASRLVPLWGYDDPRGRLTSLEEGREVPFTVRRVYLLHDVPEEALRGGHAHKALHQVVLAAAGSFTLRLDDGIQHESFTLATPRLGLYIGPGLWRTLESFSPGTVALVLASAAYDEGDYIRDYADFQRFVGVPVTSDGPPAAPPVAP